MPLADQKALFSRIELALFRSPCSVTLRKHVFSHGTVIPAHAGIQETQRQTYEVAKGLNFDQRILNPVTFSQPFHKYNRSSRYDAPVRQLCAVIGSRLQALLYSLIARFRVSDTH